MSSRDTPGRSALECSVPARCIARLPAPAREHSGSPAARDDAATWIARVCETALNTASFRYGRTAAASFFCTPRLTRKNVISALCRKVSISKPGSSARMASMPGGKARRGRAGDSNPKSPSAILARSEAPMTDPKSRSPPVLDGDPPSRDPPSGWPPDHFSCDAECSQR